MIHRPWTGSFGKDVETPDLYWEGENVSFFDTGLLTYAHRFQCVSTLSLLVPSLDNNPWVTECHVRDVYSDSFILVEVKVYSFASEPGQTPVRDQFALVISSCPDSPTERQVCLLRSVEPRQWLIESLEPVCSVGKRGVKGVDFFPYYLCRWGDTP